MRHAHKITVAILVLLVTCSFAANKVKSKLGDIDITSEMGGGKVVCTAGFNDELLIVKKADTEVLVKGSCGQGWVAKSKLEYVAQQPGDNSMKFTAYDIHGWIDNPSAFEIFANDVEDFDGVTIDRDFKEYLVHTLDREQVEMSNAEN